MAKFDANGVMCNHNQLIRAFPKETFLVLSGSGITGTGSHAPDFTAQPVVVPRPIPDPTPSTSLIFKTTSSSVTTAPTTSDTTSAPLSTSSTTSLEPPPTSSSRTSAIPAASAPIPAQAPQHPLESATIKDTHTLSAGPIAGVVIGSVLVLAIGISVSICVYRRRYGRRHQQMEEDCVSPLQQTAHADADSNANLDQASGEKGHHNRNSTMLIPNLQAPEPELTSISEFLQPESSPNISSGSHLIPSPAQIQEDVNQDIQVKVVRMEATMGRMAEQIRHLESQLV
ncbi:hypothetical protein BDP27DRAFT_1366258 [Rhodocollybia butyracea]|uniref:Uncharacterized protein n=1 Tax=Rhodocollybia butyracea TaxID=206335 RepID=A0A9P5PLU5_9AGAR|nr:hypothetical protein BDP27DRAFT_1366258 [Rhodocollybia butyracea]